MQVFKNSVAVFLSSVVAVIFIMAQPAAHATPVGIYEIHGSYFYFDSSGQAERNVSGTGVFSASDGNLIPQNDGLPGDDTNFDSLFIDFEVSLIDDEGTRSYGSLSFQSVLVRGGGAAVAEGSSLTVFGWEFREEGSPVFQLFVPLEFPDSFGMDLDPFGNQASGDRTMVHLDLSFEKVLPVPEPATYMMFFSVLGIMMLRRWKMRG